MNYCWGERLSNIAVELNDVAVARNAAEIVTGENVMKIAATDEDLNSYHQVLCLELEETEMEKVLETMAELEKQENVFYAGSDYVLTIDSTTPNDPGYTDGSQWAIDKIKLLELTLKVCGTCWNVRLVSLKVLDSGGYGYSSNAIKAVDFAELWSIPIINFSVGWYSTNWHYDEAMNQLFGIVCVCCRQ